MKSQLLILAALVLWPACSQARSTPQKLWTLPVGAHFEGLSERPNHQIGVYWSPKQSSSGYPFNQFSILDEAGQFIRGGEVPGQHFTGNGIAMEDWNTRGQHAFLPQCDGATTNLLRLKSGDSYRVLLNLPRFDENTLQDVKFSPDGECLYVVGKSRLWIIGAQSARLLRIVEPRWGKKWSDENAVLSPDCRRILGMRGKMALFSTSNGKLLSRFGTKIETLTGGCGSIEAIVCFSKDGRFAVASMQGTETWVYATHNHALLWSGLTPYDMVETSQDHFFLDTKSIDDYGAATAVLRRWRDGKIGWHLKLDFKYKDLGPCLFFSRDGKWIYFARNQSVWRVPMPQFS